MISRSTAYTHFCMTFTETAISSTLSKIQPVPKDRHASVLLWLFHNGRPLIYFRFLGFSHIYEPCSVCMKQDAICFKTLNFLICCHLKWGTFHFIWMKTGPFFEQSPLQWNSGLQLLGPKMQPEIASWKFLVLFNFSACKPTISLTTAVVLS